MSGQRDQADHDGIYEFLDDADMPHTRENYLFVLWGGNPPDELDEEDELLLPEHLRLSEDGDVGRVSRETIPGSRTTVFSTGVPTALPRVR